MPAIPRQAESYTKPWVQQGKAGRLCVAIYPPTSNMDQHLRTQQHLNNLQAFLDYEQRLRDAYAKSQDPQPGRWLRSNNNRQHQRNRKFTSLG